MKSKSVLSAWIQATLTSVGFDAPDQLPRPPKKTKDHAGARVSATLRKHDGGDQPDALIICVGRAQTARRKMSGCDHHTCAMGRRSTSKQANQGIKREGDSDMGEPSLIKSYGGSSMDIYPSATDKLHRGADIQIKSRASNNSGIRNLKARVAATNASGDAEGHASEGL